MVRSPHVNMRIGRETHDRLVRLSLSLSAAAGRRLSLTDMLTIAVTALEQHPDLAAAIARGEAS